MADWNPRVNELFLKAFELADPAARDAILARECGDDWDLRRAVETLLKAHDEAGGFLADPHPALGGTGKYRERAEAGVPSVSTDDLPGREEHVGAVLAGKYKLVEEIGEGGMGTVFMAQQTEPVKRVVAVKVIKSGMDSKAVLARFEAERQALAMMDHPNIARVLDAGTTDGGRPFFVMELVKGVPITRYCDERKLTPRQRLELFVPVCQAIQHAHQKGIIHRDIKPRNVLVALYDDRPVPKVIDFGVAKAAGSALTDKTLLTGFGAVIGTPEYMSPEQANLNNLDIDTRSDVYSLGVLLYELLTGTTPVDRKSLGKAALLEVLRIVREVEAPRPSAKLSSSDTLPSVAACRGTEPAKLSKLMRGELDWVVLKALEKDRTRRYETANGLARDIQRYLADEVVEARPPSAAYRLRKALRRNKGPVLATSLVLFALLAGIAGTTWQSIRAEHAWAEEASQRATAEENARRANAAADGERRAKLDAETKEQLAVAAAGREHAARLEEERQRTFAEAIRRFVEDDFLALTSVEGQDRFGGEGKETLSKDTTLAQLLDRAAEKLRARKDLDPRIEAELCWIVGVNYRGAGEAKKSIDFLERAVQLRSELLGRDHADTLKAMNSLGVAYDAVGRQDLAVPLYEETLRLMKARLGPEHPSTLSSMNNLAAGYYAAGKLDKALLLFEEALKLQKAKLGPEHPSTLLSMNNLAQAYQTVGKLGLALTLYEETLKLRKARLGPDHPDTLSSMNGLAYCYQCAGRLDLALPLLEETLKLMKARLGPDHPTTLTSMSSLAVGYQAAGKLDLAVPLHEETLKLMKARLGPDHPTTLTSMSSLAVGYQAAGKLDLALPLYEETLKLRKAKLGPEHPDTLHSMNDLASAYKAAGKLEVALPLYEETLKLRKARLGPEHPSTLHSMNGLAQAYQAAGKLDLALPLHEETLKLRKAKLGPEHPDTLHSMNGLAYCYQCAGRLDLALPLLEETLKLMKARLGPEHPSTLTSMSSLAAGYQAAGKLDLALPLFEETLKLMKARLGPEHPTTLTSMNNLAAGYYAAGKLDLAVPLLVETLRLQKAKLGPEHPDTLHSMNGLAMAYWSAKRFDKSIPLFEETLKLQEAKLGRDHQSTLLTVANLGVNYEDAGRLKEAIPLLEEAHRAVKKYPALGWVGPHLLYAYVKAGENAKLGSFVQEELANARKAFPKDSPQLAQHLASTSFLLLQANAFTEAEPLLRECLAIREKTQPDVWKTFNVMSMLGGALLGQKKYAEAEPLLLAGYAGMKQREKTIPLEGKDRLPLAAERLVQLYEATGKLADAAKWRVELAKYPVLAPMPREEK